MDDRNFTRPRISVIIPIFNHEDYVVECLASLVAQDFQDFEIVAIDDGSSDRSYQFAKEFLDGHFSSERFRLWAWANKGINATLNEAISRSRGEVVYPLASDDRLPGDALSGVWTAYLARRGRKPRLFFYDVALIDCSGATLAPSGAARRPGGSSLLAKSPLYLKTEMILDWGLPFSHQFYSRTFFDRCGPYPEELAFEDLYLALQGASRGKVTFIAEVLKEYRLETPVGKHRASATSSWTSWQPVTRCGHHRRCSLTVCCCWGESSGAGTVPRGGKSRGSAGEQDGSCSMRQRRVTGCCMKCAPGGPDDTIRLVSRSGAG